MTDDTRDEDDTMAGALSVAERDSLRARLRTLPDTMPPRAVWLRIERQARAERLLRGRRWTARLKWVAGAAIAATVAVVVLRLPAVGPESTPEAFPTVPEYQGASNVSGLRTVNALMSESRQIERDLRALPREPRVVRAGTAATILELEDRIAAIDYVLNDPALQLSDAQAEAYWRERVRLMNSLLRLRYAQAQRMAF